MAGGGVAEEPVHLWSAFDARNVRRRARVFVVRAESEFVKPTVIAIRRPPRDMVVSVARGWVCREYRARGVHLAAKRASQEAYPTWPLTTGATGGSYSGHAVGALDYAAQIRRPIATTANRHLPRADRHPDYGRRRRR